MKCQIIIDVSTKYFEKMNQIWGTTWKYCSTSAGGDLWRHKAWLDHFSNSSSCSILNTMFGVPKDSFESESRLNYIENMALNVVRISRGSIEFFKIVFVMALLIYNNECMIILYNCLRSKKIKSIFVSGKIQTKRMKC